MEMRDATAHPVRAEIMAVLEEDEMSEHELRRELIELPEMPVLGYHLHVLERAGLIVWEGGIYRLP